MHLRKTTTWIPIVAIAATLATARTAEAGSKNRITAVSFEDAGQSTTIHVRGSETPTFTVYKLERPNRVVVDISGATLADSVKEAQENGATLPVATWAVNQVAAYELDDGGSLVRVVVTLARPGRYDVDAKDDDVVVKIVARDAAPEKVDADDVAAAKAAAAKAKAESDEAKQAKTQAEQDAALAKSQAETAKQDAKTAKKALADAQARAEAAAKASKTEKDAAAAALAEAKAEVERTRKAADDAKALADKTKKTVAAAKADAERAEAAADQARAELDTVQAQLEAAKAETARQTEVAASAKAEAAKSKKDAAAARADADQARKDAGDAAAQAAERAKEASDAKARAADREAETAKAKADAAQRAAEAEAAKAEAARDKLDAAAAKKEAARDKQEAAAAKKEAAKAKADADKLEAEAEAARAEAKQARKDAEAAQAQADQARKDAAAAKAEAAAHAEDAVAAKRDADDARAAAAAEHKDAEAMRAEAEAMLADAKQRLTQAETEAKAAKKSKKAADAALAKAESKETAARDAEAKAADERRAAEDAVAAAEKARKAGDRDAAKQVADAEARLAKAEKARAAAEDLRVAAEANAETARAEADRRKQEAADAVAARATADREKKAAQAAADEASERAAKSEALRQDEVAAARKAADARAAAEQAEADKASKKEIAAKQREADKLEKAAASARASREQEEAQLASVVAERREAEQALAQARADRAAAEQAAETARADAETARQRAAASKRDAEDAEARARTARADADAAQADAKAAKAAKATVVADVDAKPAKAAKKTKAAKATVVADAPAKPAAKATITVKDVSFDQDGDDALVTIALSGEVEPVVHTSAGRAEMVLDGVSLPTKLERTLDVSKFDGAVSSISSYRDPKDADKVKVVVELSGEATPTLEQDGKSLRWHFAGAVAKKSGKPAGRAKAKFETDDIPAPVVGGYGASSAPVTSKSVAQSGGKRKVYRGPTINLDFKDADIHNLLRFLANIGRVSIVVPDDIKATVTVRLQRVPWDQALEVILASKGLWYRKDGNLYRVAPRKQLDEEDEQEAARIKAAVQAEVPEAEVFTLNYASAAEQAKKLEPLLSPKGKIEVDTRTNSLIINDIKAHRRRIVDLAARLDTQTPQIMIEARIVEARSTYARDIGIQWGGSINANQANNSSTGLIWPNNIGIAGGGEDRQTPTGGVSAPSDFAVNLPATTGTGTGGAIGMTLGSVGGTVNVSLRLSAAEDEGSVRIISSPKITVLNNTEATISQGVSIPISIVSAQGTQTQFEDADLSLTVTPYVSQRDCSIAMDVKVTKNEPDFVNTGARGDPTILRKEAKSKILVQDGETTVMGGITTRNTGLSYNKIPFFGDLPVVGWLFKHRKENDDRTELLIFLTPKITNKAFLRCE